MPTVEDIARLKLETIGAAGLQELRDKIKALPLELGELTAAFGRGDITLEEYEKDAKRLTDTYRQLSGELKTLDAAAKKSAGGMAGLGQAGLQTGRVIQDFAQGGIAGILNNIEGLTMALGGGPGLAGALTGVGIAFFLLKKPIQDFLASLSGPEVPEFTDEMQALKKRIDDLTKKPIKLAIDMIELENAQQRLKEMAENAQALQAALSGKTVFEKEAGEQFQQNFGELGQEGKQVTEEIIARRTRELSATSETIKAVRAAEAAAEQAIAAAEARLAHATSEGAAREASAAIEGAKQAVADARANADKARLAIAKEARDQVGAMFRGVGAGNDADARERLAAEFRKSGRHDLAGLVESSTPQEMERQGAIEDETEAGIERQKAGMAARKKQKARRDAEQNALDDEAKEDKRQSDAWLKQQADKKKQAKTKADQELNKRVAVVQRGIDQRAKAMEGFQAQGEAFLAEGLASGQFAMNRQGQLSDASLQRLTEAIAERVGREMPGLNRGDAAGLTNALAASIEKGVGEKLLGQVGGGLNAQMATQAVVMETQAAVAALGNKLNQVIIRNNNLARNAAQLNRMAAAPGPPPLPAGQQ